MKKKTERLIEKIFNILTFANYIFYLYNFVQICILRLVYRVDSVTINPLTNAALLSNELGTYLGFAMLFILVILKILKKKTEKNFEHILLLNFSHYALFLLTAITACGLPFVAQQ